MTPAQRSLRGRLGAYAALARNDATEINAKARQVYRDSFQVGHECRLCPRIDIPPDLPEAERSRRSETLRRAHYARLAMRSSQARAARG